MIFSLPALEADLGPSFKLGAGLHFIPRKAAPSSSGSGHQILILVRRVRIPLGSGSLVQSGTLAQLARASHS